MEKLGKERNSLISASAFPSILITESQNHQDWKRTSRYPVQPSNIKHTFISCDENVHYFICPIKVKITSKLLRIKTQELSISKK